MTTRRTDNTLRAPLALFALASLAGSMACNGDDRFEPCGGDPTGAWVVTDVELSRPPGADGMCAGSRHTGSAVVHEGWAVLGPDGSYRGYTNVDATTTSVYPSECGGSCSERELLLSLSGEAECTESEAGCTCTQTLVGVESEAAGAWAVDEMGRLVVTASGFGAGVSNFCARGDTLELVDESGQRIHARRAAPGEVPGSSAGPGTPGGPGPGECSADTDCVGPVFNGIALTMCHPDRDLCVGCVTDANCGDGQFCLEAEERSTCANCRDDADCAEPSSPFCVDTPGFGMPSRSCRECRSFMDCAGGGACASGFCL